jgi:hypothetical protein
MSHYNDSKSDQIFSREPLKKRAAPIWRDLRLLVAVQLYMLGRISSDRAAKLADVPHVEFLLSLGFYKVFPLQAELVELERVAQQAKNKPKASPTPTELASKSAEKESRHAMPSETTLRGSEKSSAENPPDQDTR